MILPAERAARAAIVTWGLGMALDFAKERNRDAEV
jgi:hypothetical protein